MKDVPKHAKGRRLQFQVKRLPAFVSSKLPSLPSSRISCPRDVRPFHAPLLLISQHGVANVTPRVARRLHAYTERDAKYSLHVPV